MKVSNEILNLVPYKPGKPIAETQREYGIQEVIKLASNENSLGPSPKAIDAIRNHLSQLHRYPDPSFFDLIQVLARDWKVPKEYLSIGNGSNEIIDLLIRIFCEPKEAILTMQYCFVAYPVCAQAARVQVYYAKVNIEFELDLQDLRSYLNQSEVKKIRLVFIPNPNNPTGVLTSSRELKKLVDEYSSNPNLLFIFDEAYFEFIREPDYQSAIGWVTENPQIAVIRTLSKAYGLAGIRVGVLIAHPSVIDLYNRVRNPFNINDLAQVAAVAALQDKDFVKKSKEMVWEGLDYFYAELKKLGLNCIKSQGNFVLFDTQRDIIKLNEMLLRKGLILRPVLNYGLKTQLRMSVGTMEENKKAIEILKSVLNAADTIEK